MSKSAVQLAKEAVLEAKAKFEADPSEANVATLESKSAEYATAVDLADRAVTVVQDRHGTPRPEDRQGRPSTTPARPSAQ